MPQRRGKPFVSKETVPEHVFDYNVHLPERETAIKSLLDDGWQLEQAKKLTDLELKLKVLSSLFSLLSSLFSLLSSLFSLLSSHTPISLHLIMSWQMEVEDIRDYHLHQQEEKANLLQNQEDQLPRDTREWDSNKVNRFDFPLGVQ
jgi:hypothetical protein